MTSYRYARYGVYSDEETLEDIARCDRTVYLGRLDARTKYDDKLPDDLLEVPYTTGSDYSGDSVTVSNYRRIWEDYKDKIPELFQMYGDYSSYGLLITRRALEAEEENAAELRDVIDKLVNSYCVYDEDDMGLVELEAESESWDNCYRYDYRRELERLELIADCEEDSTDDVPYLDDEQLFSLVRLVMGRENVYWTHETGNNAYLDVTRLAENTTDEDIQSVLKAN